MKTTRILLAISIALAALWGCTKFDPVFPGGHGSYSGGNGGSGSGGNGGNGGSGSGGGQQTATPTLQNAWKIEYQGRGVYTEDGSNDTVENFKLTYTGQAYYIIRMVDKGSVTDLAKFFNEEASALSNDKFTEDVNNVFNDSRVVSFDLLLHGEYDVYMIEISQKKKATMSYQKASIEVVESEASADYLKWIGSWRVSDGLIGYDIDIEHAENNLLYYVWGWESGPAAMNQDMGEDWLFVRYDPSEKGLAFYVQTIGEDNDPDGSRFDKVFVGTWTESSGEVVDDLEGAVIARSGENEKGELALIPETVEFDNGAMPTYMTMRYSSYSYNDELWYHYNANVPSLYKLVNKVMTYPLTMTKQTKSSLSLRLGTEPDREDIRFKAKVHGSARRRPVQAQ